MGSGNGTHACRNQVEQGWIEYQKISARALLELAARHKETILWNAAQKALRQTERGAATAHPPAMESR